MSGKREIFLATGNAHKIDEISALLGDTWTVKSFRTLSAPLNVPETETTLEGNSRLKAMAYHAATGLPCLADDSGLEVEALGGAPGVYSSSYGGEEGNAVRNIERLMREMEGQTNRKARFRTVIAWYDGQTLRYFEGELAGSIGDVPRGTGGFGYDPLFIPAGQDRTLAEYSPAEKNEISHRGNAVRKLISFLQSVS